MRIVDAYRYLYYRIYSWNFRIWEKQDGPEFNALLGVSFLLFGNILTIAFGLDLLFSTRFFGHFVAPSKLGVVVLLMLIGVGNYFIFLRGRRFERLVQRFGKESAEVARRRLIFCMIYVAATFILFFLIAGIRRS